jgi:hypothetical protein
MSTNFPFTSSNPLIFFIGNRGILAFNEHKDSK